LLLVDARGSHGQEQFTASPGASGCEFSGGKPVDAFNKSARQIDVEANPIFADGGFHWYVSFRWTTKNPPRDFPGGVTDQGFWD
jgi:hypothetical protein